MAETRHHWAETLALIALLGSTDSAQERSRGYDPTTGRRQAPRLQHKVQRSPKTRFVAGQVIGFTTDVITEHLMTLPEFVVASNDLIADGHTLVPINSLDAASLSGIDRLFVGLLSFTAFEIDMDKIEAFVRGGGDLVYVGENNISWHEVNVVVGGRFGIEYPLEDPVEVFLTDIAVHPITLGPFGEVNTVAGPGNQPRFFGSMSSPGPYGRALALFPHGNSGAVVVEPGAFAPGAGSIIAFSESTIFSDCYQLGDNRELWRNAFAYDPPITRVVFDFETEDDFETPLANGQGILSPEEFGHVMSVAGYGPDTYGAAIFDSSPGGPNAGGSDPDLLVDLGNILILQENGLQSTPDFYDDLDDAQLGGTLAFDFFGPALVESIDLIDICPGPPNQDVTLTLFDANGRTRTYFVPSGWTNDLFADGPPGFRTLDLTTLDPQPGYAATTSATQASTFAPNELVRLEVALNSSGAIDNLVVELAPDPGPFRILSCSLGCFFDGFEISCSEHDIAVNEEIRVTFNKPFDLSSVNANTFRVTAFGTGAAAAATYRVDPADPRVLIFKPLLSFDSAGNPIFGLEEGETYAWAIPGRFDPLCPRIRSRMGELNLNRLSCTLIASEGVQDESPGLVLATSIANVFNTVTDRVEESVLPSPFAVVRSSDITLRFNDVMNPATLVNPVTGQSPTITLLFDPDFGGNTGDEIPIPGNFTLTIDQIAKETTVVFDPADDLPADAFFFLVTTAAIQDLAGNLLFNHGMLVFRTATN